VVWNIYIYISGIFRQKLRLKPVVKPAGRGPPGDHGVVSRGFGFIPVIPGIPSLGLALSDSGSFICYYLCDK
jgi:hypothetical protein